MTFFLTYWKELAIAAITAIVLGYTYHAGGNAPRAELAALRAAGQAQNSHTATIDAQTTEVFTHANQTAASAFAAIDNHWLLKPASLGKVPFPAPAASGTEPAPEAGRADTCTDRDSAHDAEQVILLQTYYEQQRALINAK